jgi:phage virion morphogenesis protein
MAGAFIEVSIGDTERDIVAALERLRGAVANLRPALAEIGEYLLQSTERRFKTQAGPDGAAWAPLSPDYAKRKKKNRDLILVLNGYLADFQAPQVDDDKVSVGTALPYGAAHQFGRPEKNLPARPFLGLDDADAAEILAIIADHLEQAQR